MLNSQGYKGAWYGSLEHNLPSENVRIFLLTLLTISSLFRFFQDLPPPTPETTVPASLGLFRVFPGGWRLLTPALSQQG